MDSTSKPLWVANRDLKRAVPAAVLTMCVNRRQEQTEQNLEKAVLMFKGQKATADSALHEENQVKSQWRRVDIVNRCSG